MSVLLSTQTTRTIKMRQATLFFLITCITVFHPAFSNAVNTGDQLIPFQATTLDGKAISIDQNRDSSPIMLVFWASWCSNCARELPLINELLESEIGKNLQVIAINVGYNDSLARIERFINKTDMSYPVIFDRNSTITSQYKVLGVPTIIIADTKGTIVFRQYYVPDEQILETLLP